MIILSLPMPPSVNELFANMPERGRIPTRKYKAWQEEAGYAVNRQAQNPLTGPVAVDVTFGKGRSDLDNRAKPILDLLVKRGLIEGDGPNVVRAIFLQLDDSVSGCRVVVRHV